jgi:hypothetical protein
MNNHSHPNGTVHAYYGDSKSCKKFEMDKADYQFALGRPDGAMWASEPQSSTVVDMTAAGLAASGRWHSQGVDHPEPPSIWAAEHASKRAAGEANHAAHEAFLAAVEDDGRLHPHAAIYGLHP